MMVYWSTRIAYTTNLLTLNSVRLAEHLYKGLANIWQGGAKPRADMAVVIIIIASFVIGTIFGILSTNPDHFVINFVFSLVFIAIFYPLHLLYGYYYPMLERKAIEKEKEQSQDMTVTSNPINKKNQHLTT
jgi:hypothetical protein